MQNKIQHTRLRVWLVELVGMIGTKGMESRRVMDLVRCGHVEEVQFESEGWFGVKTPFSNKSRVSSSVSVRETQATKSCLIDGCGNDQVEDHIETRLRLVSRTVSFPSRNCQAVQVYQWYVSHARLEENWMCGICRYSASCQLTSLSNLVALHNTYNCSSLAKPYGTPLHSSHVLGFRGTGKLESPENFRIVFFPFQVLRAIIRV